MLAASVSQVEQEKGTLRLCPFDTGELHFEPSNIPLD